MESKEIKKQEPRIWSCRAPWVKIYNSGSSGSYSSPVAPIRLKKSRNRDFGEYITNEYGLLKEILLYLDTSDLWAARNVCRRWRAVVDLLVDKNPLILCCPKPDGNFTPNVPRRIIPSVVIHQNVHFNTRTEKCEICKKLFYLCPCGIISPGTAFLSLGPCCITEVKVRSNRMYKFWQNHSALILPSSEEINISRYCIKANAKVLREPVTDELVTRIVGGLEPIKCLLIIARHGRSSWVGKILEKLVARQGTTFAVGGGEIQNFESYKFNCPRRHRSTWYTPKYFFLTFRGEGVSAHSDILYHQTDGAIVDFMDELARRAGPIPEGGTRIGFLAHCVARTDSYLERIESLSFDNAFPSVPQIGFHAHGEYGMQSSSTEAPEPTSTNKKMKMTFDYTNTTSVTILTFNKISTGAK